MWASQITFSIRIFDLQEVRQGHEVQLRRLRSLMAIGMIYIFMKNRVHVVHQRGMRTRTQKYTRDSIGDNTKQ